MRRRVLRAGTPQNLCFGTDNSTGRRELPEAERLRASLVSVAFKKAHGLVIRAQKIKESVEARAVVLTSLTNPRVHQVEQGFLRHLKVADLRK